MSSKIQAALEKMMPFMLKFANLKGVQAMKDGFILTIPLTMIGSLFLLVTSFPVDGYYEFMAGQFGADWATPFYQVVGSTFDIIAIAATFGIAHAYVKNEGFDGVTAGILALASLFIVSNSFVISEAGDVVGGVIPKEFMGGQGTIAAIIIGLTVGFIYAWFLKKDIRFKMPDGVPQGVVNAFSALIPGFVIITLSFLVFIISDAAFGVSMVEKIYEIIQTPIQNMTDTPATAIMFPLLISLLWWCGIHGAAIVMGVMGPILTANALSNQAVLDAGNALVVGENAKVMTIQFDQFLTLGGTGITIGLLIAMIIAAKSAHFKQLSKLCLVPGLFNINEPVIFGTPIVFNPIMLIPFTLVPVLSSIMVYASISIGFLEPFTGVMVPWATPPVINAFMIGGIKAVILQVAVIAMSVAIYLPFMKMQDNIYYKDELKAAEGESADA